MAKDFLLKHLCPHYVVSEWLSIESNRVALNTIRYPASSEIRIVWNGIDVPREGVVSKVSFASKNSQPFEIVKDDNDIFRFEVNGGPLQTVKLPSGLKINAEQIAKAINEQSSGIKASSSFGRIRLETIEGGPETTLFLRGGNSHSDLGFPISRFYQGREVVPPWKIVRSDSVDELARQIVFERPLKAIDDIFEVSYYTRPQDCRRCGGLGVENDIRHDTYGNPEMVAGIDLLAQEAEKIVFTIRGSNLFYTWYGTSLMNLVGQKIATRSGGILESQLVSEIGQTLERYRDIKTQQSRFQPMGDQEFLMRVRNIFVAQDANDPTVFRIKIDLQNRAGEVDELRKTLVVNTRDGFEFLG